MPSLHDTFSQGPLGSAFNWLVYTFPFGRVTSIHFLTSLLAGARSPALALMTTLLKGARSAWLGAASGSYSEEWLSGIVPGAFILPSALAHSVTCSLSSTPRSLPWFGSLCSRSPPSELGSTGHLLLTSSLAHWWRGRRSYVGLSMSGSVPLTIGFLWA